MQAKNNILHKDYRSVFAFAVSHKKGTGSVAVYQDDELIKDLVDIPVEELDKIWHTCMRTGYEIAFQKKNVENVDFFLYF